MEEKIAKYALIAIWLMLSIWSTRLAVKSRMRRRGEISLGELFTDLLMAFTLGWFIDLTFKIGGIVVLKKKQDD